MPTAVSTVYCTPQQLADNGIAQKILDTIAPETVAGALASASSFIDSYIGRVFTLPLLSYGGELTECAAKIAAWNLLSVRGFNPGTDQGQLLESRYNGAVRWLKDIAEGRAKPSWPATVTASGFNPTAPVFALAPRQGGIGLGSDCPGTPGKPRSRGW